MTIYDVTIPIRAAMPVWPSDPPVEVEPLRSMDQGYRANVSRLSMSSHAGTHVDAPAHFVHGGETVDRLPLDLLIGPAWVAEFDASDAITADMLQAAGIPREAERLLIKTANSALWAAGHDAFSEDFTYLTEDAAGWAVHRGMRLVGIDYLSIQGFHDDEARTHNVLLEAGVVIVEGLNLADVSPGWYELLCLPLKVANGDGAPARVVLRGGPHVKVGGMGA